jgi:hypothetical protein
MHLSRQPGIGQQFVRELEQFLAKLGILQLQLFDLLARFREGFVLNLAHLNNQVVSHLFAVHQTILVFWWAVSRSVAHRRFASW